jgi:hypothetical protein
MNKTEILEIIEKEITSWPYVTSEIHRFGGIEFRINKREMGHIHNEGLADLPFPMNIRNELVHSEKVKPHHVLPQSGWVSYWFNNNIEDIQAVIELFRLRYEQLKPENQIKSTINQIGKK